MEEQTLTLEQVAANMVILRAEMQYLLDRIADISDQLETAWDTIENHETRLMAIETALNPQY